MIDLNNLGAPGTFEVRESDVLDGTQQVAFFYDEEGNPAKKKDASRVNILILDSDGNRINEVYGVL